MDNKILTVLPFHAGDIELAKQLLRWIAELGGCRDNQILLVADCVLSDIAIRDVEQIADKVFESGETVKTLFKLPKEENPIGANWMFETAARHIGEHQKLPFLWLEPDCVPLTKDWLSRIEIEYATGEKPFLGEFSTTLQKCAVYPANTHARFARSLTNKLIHWSKTTGILIHETCHSNLISHSVSFQKSCVLLHGCKDGSMFSALRRDGAGKRTPITIRRRAAIGDTVMTLAVAKKLNEAGFDVDLATENICAEALRGSPHIKRFVPLATEARINLDDAYETHPDRRKRATSVLFLESAKAQLNGSGFKIQDFHNITPELTVTEEERAEAREKLQNYPKPWVMVCPRSDFWPNRTVPNQIWKKAADAGPGTWFWTGTVKAPDRFIDLKCSTIRKLMAFLSLGNVAVSVDSGPLHLAAALGIPIVAILQSSSPEVHLTDQRDYTVISPALGCLNCQLNVCPINRDDPPCRNVDPMMIAAAVSRKLESIAGNRISAVIPVWKPNVERLNRCIKHTLHQVDEIIIAIDGDGAIPAGITRAPGVRIVQNPTGERRGYGKTVNFGVRHASGRYLLLLNDDVFLNPDAVANMGKSMSPDTAVVGCRLWYPNGTIQHGGTSRRSSDFGWGHLDHRQKAGTITVATEMECVTFAAVLVRREAFYEVLGFDERYDCYCEDNDFCLSVRQKGWRVIYEPRAEGIHDESQTSGPLKAQMAAQSEHKFREKWGWYFHKNPPGKLGVFA